MECFPFAYEATVIEGPSQCFWPPANSESASPDKVFLRVENELDLDGFWAFRIRIMIRPLTHLGPVQERVETDSLALLCWEYRLRPSP